MKDRSVPWTRFFEESVRLLLKFALFAVLLWLLSFAATFVLGSQTKSGVFIGIFSALFFLAAPLASSALRKQWRQPLFSRSTLTAALFCFVWGAIAAASFIGTLQLVQGMDATLANYVAAMTFSGFACAAIATLPAAG